MSDKVKSQQSTPNAAALFVSLVQWARAFATGPWGAPLALLLIILLGLWLRYDDVLIWEAHPSSAIAPDGGYYTTTYDGYYYLLHARDLADNAGLTTNELRAQGAVAGREGVVPLLGYTIGGLARITGMAEHTLAALLMPLLAMATALAVYELGKLFGGRGTGLAAALFTVCAPYYAYRSNVGWIDTDGLNVFFTVLLALLMARFALTEGRDRYRYYLYALLIYPIFLWWWEMSPGAVTASIGLPWLAAMIFYFRAKGDELRYFVIVHGVLLALALILFGDRIWHEAGRALGQLSYLSGGSGSGSAEFPGIGVSISEQDLPPFSRLAGMLSGQAWAMGFVIVGLIWLAIEHFKRLFLLGALLLLGSFAFIFAQRFMIFAVPLAGLGLGYLVQRLWDLRLKHIGFAVASLASLSLVAVAQIANTAQQVYPPKPKPPFVESIVKLRQTTPEDAVIWTWWDYAYPIMYWGQRATLADGAYHGGELLTYLGRPMSVSDSRLAANYMEFFAVRQRAGMRTLYRGFGNDKPAARAFLEQVMASGPEGLDQALESAAGMVEPRSREEWLDFLFPPAGERRPVYLMFDADMIAKAYWWYWFGTWDADKGEGVHARVPHRIQGVRRDAMQLKGRDFSFDIQSGRGTIGTRTFAVRQSLMIGARGGFTKPYDEIPKRYPSLLYYQQIGRVMLIGQPLADSLFGRLYFGFRPDNERFQPIFGRHGGTKVWRVVGDRRE